MHGRRSLVRVAVVGIALVAGATGCSQPARSLDAAPSIPALASSAPQSNPAPKAAGDRLAYVAPVGGIDQLFVLEPDGRSHQVSQNDGQFGGLLYGPRWSPDGSRIAFGVGMPPLSTWVVNADGTDLRQVSSGRILGPWSPDGRQIIVSEYLDVEPPPGHQLLSSILDVDDGSEAVITDGSPIAWLPDGRVGLRRFSMQGSAISILDLETRDETLLLDADDAAWSPDGGRIAFTRHTPCPPPPCSMIGVANADGNDAMELGGGMSPVWSPDGERLAYVDLVDIGPATRLQLMTADGRPIEVPELTLAGAIGWSPDGSRLAITAGNPMFPPFELVVYEVGGESTTIGPGSFAGYAPAD